MVTKIISNKEYGLFSFGLFTLNFLYSFFLCKINQEFSAGLTIAFLFLLFVFFIWAAQLCSITQKPSSALCFVLICCISIHLALILGVYVAAPISSILWVPDSVSNHVPGAQYILDIIHGHDIKEKIDLYDRTYLTHALVALFFKLFGVNHIASSLALIIPKLITLLLIFKITLKIESEKLASLAALIYCFLPTQIFYSLVYYKEAVVQMLVALLIYILFQLNQKLNWRLIPTFIGFSVALLLLGNERHYLLPCYVASVFSLAFLSKKISTLSRILALAACFISYKLFFYYYTDISYQSIVATVLAYRKIFLAYPDVSPINHWLPYPIAVIKLFFSPYFTFDKLKTYHYFAGLLTFGSLFYHIIAASFIIGIFRKFRDNQQIRIVIVQLIPLFLFLAVFGYVAPYDGRARDSFLPLIVLYGTGVIANSPYFNSILTSFNALKKWILKSAT